MWVFTVKELMGVIVPLEVTLLACQVLQKTMAYLGQLITRAIDSGMPRCRWHRVRVDADVPSGTTLEIAVATSELDPTGKEPPPQGDPTKAVGWEKFKAGVPHLLDWQVAPAGTLDFLIKQPPGRHLYVRLRPTGDSKASPVVRRVRLARYHQSSFAVCEWARAGLVVEKGLRQRLPARWRQTT